MDLTVLIQEFAKAGILFLAMGVVIYALWGKLEKKENENISYIKTIIEQAGAYKALNENTQALLVLMKDEIKATRETVANLLTAMAKRGK